MKIGFFRLALPMFDDENTGGSPAAPAGAPAGSGTPAAGAPAVPAAQPNAQPAGFTYKEDRSTWVPSHVVRQRTTELEKYKADLDYERRRVAALSGVTMPPAPRNPEHDQIRQQFFDVMPEFKELADLKDKIKELTGIDIKDLQGSITSIKESQNQTWAARGNETLRTLADRVKQAYGGAELPPKQLQRISRAFVAEVGEDDEMRARYEAGDMSIIDEFIADFTGGVLDPYRRSTQAAAQPRFDQARRLPRGGGSSAVVGARPASLKPSDPGFHEAAFKRFGN